MNLAQTTFSFMLKTDLRFGAGEVNKLPDHIRAFGWKNLALVFDSGPARTAAWQSVQVALEQEFNIVTRL